MKHTGSQSGGSFDASGTGFNYAYDTHARTLDVFHAKTGSALLHMDFDKNMSKDPLGFVSTLDKSNQIKALTLSNNTSADLSETFDNHKLTPMLLESTRLARYAFDLMKGNYESFEHYFRRDAALRDVRVSKVKRFHAGMSVYTAHIETLQSQRVAVESTSLHGTMSGLSHKIIHDLVARELILNLEGLAHTLLKTSSKVSILSLILNEKFDPGKRLCKDAPAVTDHTQRNN